MNLFTIGFTKTSAQSFFDRLAESGARTLVDVRLNNVSQLAGFAKRDDLQFFLERLCGITYSHDTRLAPTDQLLGAYRKKELSWSEYEDSFRDLIGQRRIELFLESDNLDGAVLLCSEAKPHHCHRRIVAEYLRDAWDDVQIQHL